MAACRMDVAAFCAISLIASVAAADPAMPTSSVRVRAKAQISAQAHPKTDATQIRGLVSDDLGQPLSHVGLRLHYTAAETDRPTAAPRPCPPTSNVQVVPKRAPSEYASYRIETSAAGQFCVVFAGAGARGSVHVMLDDPSGLYESTSRTIAVDRTKQALVLRFYPEPAPLELESLSHTVFVDTRLAAEAASGSPRLGPVQLVLTLDDRGAHRVLDQREALPGDRVQFDATTAALGDPGPATLTVSVAGSDVLLPSKTTVRVLRTARVELALDDAPPTIAPGGGSTIVIDAHSVVQTAPTGAVEALLGGRTLGIASLESGSARLRLRGFPAASNHVAITFRYLPVDPWWIPGPPLEASLAVAPPSPWSQIPWTLGALVLGLWLYVAWRRPGRTEKPKDVAAADAPSGRPSMEILRTGAQGSGWRGELHDAHDQTAIVGARVAIYVAAIEGDGLLQYVITDEVGRFELPPIERPHPEGARLVVSARWHAKLQRPLPAEGTLAIQLVTRRRALLDRLVDWATRQGRPWSAAGEPTPGHVARIANRRRSSEVAQWAEAVEYAAYGPDPVDDSREENIQAREPRAIVRRPNDRT